MPRIPQKGELQMFNRIVNMFRHWLPVVSGLLCPGNDKSIAELRRMPHPYKHKTKDSPVPVKAVKIECLGCGKPIKTRYKKIVCNRCYTEMRVVNSKLIDNN